MSVNKRRLGAIARWLEAGAPEKKHVVGFNMRFGILYKEQKKTAKDTLACGTVCCLAGAAVQFFNKPLEFATKQLKVGYKYEGGIDSSWEMVSDEAQKLLGLTDKEAEALFSPTYGVLGCNRVEITPAWAARCVRKLIKTGKVDWVGTKKV